MQQSNQQTNTEKNKGQVKATMDCIAGYAALKDLKTSCFHVSNLMFSCFKHCDIMFWTLRHHVLNIATWCFDYQNMGLKKRVLLSVSHVLIIATSCFKHQNIMFETSKHHISNIKTWIGRERRNALSGQRSRGVPQDNHHRGTRDLRQGRVPHDSQSQASRDGWVRTWIKQTTNSTNHQPTNRPKNKTKNTPGTQHPVTLWGCCLYCLFLQCFRIVFLFFKVWFVSVFL